MTCAPFTAPAPGPSLYEPGASLIAPALVDSATAAGQALAEAVTARLVGRPARTAGGDVR